MAVLDRQRFDVRMSPELAQQLETISTETGLTRAEVFRRAVALYKRAKEVERSNGHVLLRDPDGTTREIVGL
jgi:metal-responsive CopG/Arc/MetJ family transcriptional regulator